MESRTTTKSCPKKVWLPSKSVLLLNIIMKMAYFLSCNCIKKCCTREENANHLCPYIFDTPSLHFFLANSPKTSLIFDAFTSYRHDIHLWYKVKRNFCYHLRFVYASSLNVNRSMLKDESHVNIKSNNENCIYYKH